MRLSKLHVENFGSYKEFDFSFDKLGLSLVYGPTGSGKSTILDMASWILFGVTAKDGNADEVRSWLTDETTKGELYVQTNDKKTIVVTRERGANRDLYWRDASSGIVQDDKVRGKDIKDTQKLLEESLGVSSELYLAGAYFHEFSNTGSFFVAKSRERRQLFEQIAKLDIANKLGLAVSTGRTNCSVNMESLQKKQNYIEGRLGVYRENFKDATKRKDLWAERLASDVKILQTKIELFDSEKKSRIETLKVKEESWDKEYQKGIDARLLKIYNLEKKIKCLNDEKCPKCGRSDDEQFRIKNEETIKFFLEELKDYSSQKNPYISDNTLYEEEKNHYVGYMADKLKEVNPFITTIDKLTKDLAEAEKSYNNVNESISLLENRINSLNYLYNLSNELRGELLKKSVFEIEKSTNKYLDAYFDSELKVSFSLDYDSLEVSVQKNGYDCTYKQLSKGQRGLLKLCFAVSVMKAASNKAGIHFENLFFDEVFSGLDDNLKIKAFLLFQELDKDHESILVVDHCEAFQERFDTKILVQMASDNSEVIKIS